MKRFICGSIVVAMLCAASTAARGEAGFSQKPTAAKTGGAVTIRFALSGPTDVEVAVLDAKGEVVRHLAAGVLGAKAAPPEPLKAGLAQELTWDGKDDFGRPALSGAEGPAAGGPFKVRVRAGTGVKFGRLIGSSPWSMGRITGVAADAAGNAYVMTVSSGTGNFKQIIMIGPDGEYVRTVLPFPANLPAERIADWAAFDTAPRPKNQNALGPEFYTMSSLSLLKSVDDRGLLFTDGSRLYRVARDGGMVDGKFMHGELWGKKKLPNSGGGPTHLTPSPDGKYLYLSGPYSSDTQYGHKADPDFPPGQVYRMEVGKGTMQPFVNLPTIGKRTNDGWASKNIAFPVNYTTAHGPIHDVAVDKDGHVLIADQDGQRIAVFDAAGKPVGEVPLGYPDLLAIHPKTGEVYVLTKEIKGYQQYKKSLVKLSSWKAGKAVATLDLGTDGFAAPMMTVAAGDQGTVVWISGVKGDVIRVADRGAELASLGDLSAKTKSGLNNADRIAVDRETDTVYVNDAWGSFRRFNGQTGAGGEVVALEGGKSATDLAVGPGGLIYAQIGPSFSGPLFRYTRDLKPAPFEALGSNKMSGYLYGRYHGNGGDCEKGMTVSRDGKLYVTWMFGGWVRYAVSAWGADGKPINGQYVPIDPGHAKAGTPAELKTAIIGPVPGANAGIRTDSRGRIYVGIGVHPKGEVRPAGFEKNDAYTSCVGSIVRFGPDGGAWGKEGGKAVDNLNKQGNFFEPRPRPAGALEANGGNYFVNADKIYGDFGPMSGAHEDAGGMGDPGFCHCRCGRFDLDLYDRLYVPNAITNSVRIVDNNGNLICQFGSYGNFDSQGQGSAVGAPEIPLGWPVGAGVSEKSVYVSDMLNRRAVRADLTFKAEESCEVK